MEFVVLSCRLQDLIADVIVNLAAVEMSVMAGGR